MIRLLLSLLKPLISLINRVLDLSKEREAQSRLESKNVAVDANINKWLREREAGRKREIDAAQRLSESSGGSSRVVSGRSEDDKLS